MAMRYQNGGISIDDSFARFGAKSYAIDKINTVEVRGEKRKIGCLTFLCLIGAAFFVIGGIGSIGEGKSGSSLLAITIGAALGYAFWRGYQTAKLTDYMLVLTTSSSEVQATETTDQEEVMKMRDAIEAAMVAQ